MVPMHLYNSVKSSGLSYLNLIYMKFNHLSIDPCPESVVKLIGPSIAVNYWFRRLEKPVIKIAVNQLTTLTETFFKYASKLTWLTLSENNFEFNELEQLYLYENQLTKLSENIFNGLTSLETLRLEENNLT